MRVVSSLQRTWCAWLLACGLLVIGFARHAYCQERSGVDCVELWKQIQEKEAVLAAWQEGYKALLGEWQRCEEEIDSLNEVRESRALTDTEQNRLKYLEAESTRLNKELRLLHQDIADNQSLKDTLYRDFRAYCESQASKKRPVKKPGSTRVGRDDLA